MPGRRTLLVAILIYVALDLSLASMPGAFEFDPNDSVESTQSGRSRPTAEIAASPGTPVNVFETAPQRAETPLSLRTRQYRARESEPVRVHPARATLRAAPPSEDAA